ncbi:class I SAM-dependent methyltransferase [Lactobacillaceae bacterium Scapto_B20]
MLKQLYKYGLDNPYWFYISIVSAIVLALADFKKFWWLSIIFLFITILTMLKTVRKFQIIDSLLTDQALLNARTGLDLSVGTGYQTIRLAKSALNAKITGIEDAYQHSGNRARDNVYHRQVSDRVNVIDGDITKLPLPDDSIDVVTGSYSRQTELFINSNKRRQLICDEIVRVVSKQNGIILMVNTNSQIKKMAILLSNVPGFDVYIADPELKVKFGYRAMKVVVNK